MKLIIQITGQQVKKMFSTPIIWLLLGVLLIQVAYSHTNNFLRFAEYKETTSTLISILTSRMFDVDFYYGFFGSLLNNAFLYIPLITMSSFSTEYSRGTFKLIQTSPVKDVQVVAGKFGALMVYAFLLVLVILFVTLICSWYVPNLDFKYILGSLLGFFLLTNTFLAIGLFISSLTSSQVIAALVTFSVLGVLRVLSGVGQDIPYVNDLLYWLSLSDRGRQMMDGLISSKNVIYFVMITLLFLCLTVIRLDIFRNKVFSGLNVLRFSLCITGIFLIGWVSHNPYYVFYADITRGDDKTVSKQIQEYAKDLRGEPLIFNTYVNLLNKRAKFTGIPITRNNDKKFFEPYVRFLPNLEFNYYYFYDSLPSNLNLYNQNKGLSTAQIGKNLAKAFGIPRGDLLSPEQLSAIADLRPEGNQYVRELIYDNRRSFLRMYDDTQNYPAEREVEASLKNLVKGTIKVGLVKGHSERTLGNEDEDYYWMLDGREDNRGSFRNEGYDFQPVDLHDMAVIRDIDILLVADPRSSYSDDELANLRRYIDEGGNLIFAFEPTHAQVANEILALLGLAISDTTLPPNQNEYDNDVVIVDVEDALNNRKTRRTSTFLARVRKVFLNSASHLMQDTVSTDFEVMPFLSVQSIGQTNDQPGKVDVALGLSRDHDNRQQRIFVIADADFLSNRTQRQVVDGTANLHKLIYPIFDWLSYKAKPPIPPDYKKDNQFLLSKSGAKRFRLVVLYILPSLFLLFGAVHLIIRRRK